MARRRKGSNSHKNERNRRGHNLAVRRSSPVLLAQPQKEEPSLPSQSREKGERAECSSRTRPFLGRTRRKHSLGLETIPEELLIRILSYISPLDLVRTVGLTCRRTMVLSRSPQLWRRLRLDASLDPPTESAAEGEEQAAAATPPAPAGPTVASHLLATAGSHLRCLEIEERRDAVSLVEQAAAVGGNGTPQLNTLALRRIPDSIPARTLLKTLRKFPGIKRLVLKDVRRLRSKVFFRQLGRLLPNLMSLNVGHCPQFGTAALAAVATSGLALRELRAFRERGYRSTLPHATDEDFSLFCDQMKDTITVIKINAISLTDGCCGALIQCTKLTTLHLTDSRGLSGLGILRIVTHLPKLTSLDLSGAVLLSSGNWAEVFENMAAAPQIEVLKLAGCFGIDDFAIQHMKFPKLRHLSLGGCFLIGEVGCCYIITSSPNLRHLDLEGAGGGVSRCLHLLPAYTPKLEVLVFPISICAPEPLLILLYKLKKLKLFPTIEPKRLSFWKAVAIEDQLRMLNGNVTPE
ncbi:uncharacterized protein LOC124156176 isoform X2 [Ischnura elegans]|uniref:uncharacterized protein LOC124156176 isoform X2 n=1 Tax=Ischnura elegans TaxID=197161 RepID=UPI001ED871ED|nr:uncharacterized protein LOC124156176 isoform X2 [Ischnura elegans]